MKCEKSVKFVDRTCWHFIETPWSGNSGTTADWNFPFSTNSGVSVRLSLICSKLKIVRCLCDNSGGGEYYYSPPNPAFGSRYCPFSRCFISRRTRH
jgi:hypothetical protein